MNLSSRISELVRAEIQAGTPFEVLLDAFADATIPLIAASSEVNGLLPSQIIDYFQHRQDTQLVNLLQAH